MKNIIEHDNPSMTADLIDRMIKTLEGVRSAYMDSYYSRRLYDSEYPEESVCDACEGCGVCTLTNGDVVDCFQVNTPDDSFCECAGIDVLNFGNKVNEIMIDIETIMIDIEWDSPL